ncbi:hypothetical protein BH24CHL9_BH24CHL9_10820 [soil metagenome]
MRIGVPLEDGEIAPVSHHRVQGGAEADIERGRVLAMADPVRVGGRAADSAKCPGRSSTTKSLPE